jgi:hypothetical protein
LLEDAMRFRPWFAGALAAAAGMLCNPAVARDPFNLAIDVNNDGSLDVNRGFTSIDDAIDFVDVDRLSRQTGYTGSEALDIAFFLRGIDVSMAWGTGSGVLNFDIPVLGISEAFFPRNQGAGTAFERRDAIEQLKDYLKTNRDALRKILTGLARFSPIDPLAGNPDSLFSRRQRGDFEHGFTNKVSQIWGCGTSAFNFDSDAPIQVAAVGGVSDLFADAQARAAALQAQNEVGLGILASSTTAKATGGDFRSTGVVLPFSYTAKLDSDPRKKIRFDLPLTYTDNDGALSYSLGLGLAYTHPLGDDWSLTPAVGVGATGSEDLGAAGGVGSYSLTSAYTWRLGSFALSMGNSVGRYEALGLKIGDVEAEADVSNTVFTNGFLLTGPNSLIAKNLVVEYSFVDTRITGDEVYADGYDEIGVAIGYINTEMGVIDSYTKVGLGYLIGDGAGGDISSLRLNLTARF